MDGVDRHHRSPLHDAHVALGAKLVAVRRMGDAAGLWRRHRRRAPGLPYRRGRLRREPSRHRPGRRPGAFDALQGTLTNDLRRIGPGRAQYTHLLDDDGSVVDDLIVWWVDDDRFDVMPNASNTVRVRAAVGGDDVTEERAVVAVQGPDARARLAAVAPDAAAVGRFRVTRFEWRGAPCVVAGTGYTGEDGVECAVPAAVAPAFWDAVLATGVRPAGLGARDTLRLEAGAAAPRSRAGGGDHAAAGRARLGRRLGQG